MVAHATTSPGRASTGSSREALERAVRPRRIPARSVPGRAVGESWAALDRLPSNYSVVEWPRMRQALRFTVALVAGLALLTWGASVVVSRTTRAWFERDMLLRAQLAAAGAREPLVSHWAPGHEAELRKVLVELTRDERVMGVAACGADLALKAQTIDYPASLTCSSLAGGVRPDRRRSGHGLDDLGAGLPAAAAARSHVTAVPLLDDDRALGFLVLVHDLSFIERREATTRRFLALAFGFLALGASIITLVAARLSWRGWSNELRRLIRGERPPPEFRPFLRDVRDLVERLASEREADGQGGLWTPQRLKNTLSRHLHGERVVIVANREPYIHERTSGGQVALVHPASGLVTALEPVMRACSGVWVAHGSGSGRPRGLGREGPAAGPARRGVLRPAAGVALGRGGEGLLLRLLQRGPLAPLPHRPHPAALPERGLAALPGGQPEVRRGRVRGGGHRRSHRPRPGLPLRAPAPDDSREAAPGDGPHVLAHPVAQLRAVRDLPVARRAARGAPRQQHPRLPHPVPLQQLPRRRGSLPRVPHRPGAERGRPPGAVDARPALPDLHRVAQRVAEDRAARRRVPGERLRRARAPEGRPPRRGRRPSRLHEGHRGAPAGRRAPARAQPVAAGPLHLRAAGRAQPDDHPELPAPERERDRASLLASTSASRRETTGP